MPTYPPESSIFHAQDPIIDDKGITWKYLHNPDKGSWKWHTELHGQEYQISAGSSLRDGKRIPVWVIHVGPDWLIDGRYRYATTLEDAFVLVHDSMVSHLVEKRTELKEELSSIQESYRNLC